MDPQKNNAPLLRYAGLAMQFLVSIGIGIFAGIKLDKWLKFETPVFVLVLPLLIIVGIMIAIIKDTSNKK